MTTPVIICNSALSKLGVDVKIQSLSDNTKVGRLCNAQYPIIRDELLDNHYWNFAMKRVQLAPTVDTPVFGYTYKFQLPADCIRPKSIDRVDEDFKEEDGFLLANYSDVKLLYVSNSTDVSKYYPSFREALAYRLAADLAFPIVRSRSVGEGMHILSEKRLKDARSFDGMRDMQDPLQQDVWLDSRHSGTVEVRDVQV